MKTKTSKKLTLGIAVALIPWALQKLLAGQLTRGVVALLIGAACIYAYEELQLKQLPTSAEELVDLSSAIAREVNNLDPSEGTNTNE
ncbi:MAG: hypothetical protein ABEI57_05655 [Halapricum sp.]